MKILMVGPESRKLNSTVSGQSMMFQMLVDILKENNDNVTIFDISEASHSASKRLTSSFSFLRFLEYAKVIPRIWVSLISKKTTLYLTTAQSQMGFLRDMAISWPANLFGHRIIFHQFGGNYKQFYSNQGSLFRYLIRKTLRMAEFIIVEGDYVKQQFSFLSDYDSRVQIVPNGLPERKIKGADYPKNIDGNKPFTLIYLSNLIETKGYLDVLHAVKILSNERGREIKCIFAGKFIITPDAVLYSDIQSAESNFRQYILDNYLEGVVTYHSGLYGKEKSKAFESAHVFLLPSAYINEGQPVSVLEAMAYGCAVIATDYRLIPMMVQSNKNGFFVKYGSPDEIADKIEYLMENPYVFQTISNNNIARFREKFSSQAYANRMIKILRK